MDDNRSRRSWPRVVLTIPPEVNADLHDLARHNMRDPKREATRLLLDAIARERSRLGVGR